MNIPAPSVSDEVRASGRRVLIDRDTRIKPRTVELLCDWQYLERSLHRMLCAWGRHFREWDDKSACHRHVWEQAEIVRRFRHRIAEFPGGKPDAPVGGRLGELANAVLAAPSFQDAIDGIYRLLAKALAGAYADYVQNAHPVHDAPTLRLLHEITGIKEQEWLWYRDFRRRHPHQTDTAYQSKVRAALEACGHLFNPQRIDGLPANPCGQGLDFPLPRISARSAGWRPKVNFMPYVRSDFATHVDARRFFWAYGYMMEKNLPDDQLRWIWYSPEMPWEFHYDVSRHLWDESRHGDSGYSRLRDFGISLEEVGFPPYDSLPGQSASQIAGPAGEIDPSEAGDPLTLEGLYHEVFFIGMVAETGHFEVKNEAFTDFREGDDMESAEMMLFDIIDETAHVQYAHKWLPVLADRAGVDNSGYKGRALAVRKENQRKLLERMEAEKALAADHSTPDYAFYQDCLRRVREAFPLKKTIAGLRHVMPM